MFRTVADLLVGALDNASNRLSTELARSAHARTGSAIPLRSWGSEVCSRQIAEQFSCALRRSLPSRSVATAESYV